MNDDDGEWVLVLVGGQIEMLGMNLLQHVT